MSQLYETLVTTPAGLIVVAFLGLLFGSFYNVCISRLPHDESIVFGGSHCPKCKSAIPWYLNFPVVSFIALGGKCRNCKVPISVQYPLVEIATGALFAILYARYGLGARWLAYTIFCSVLLIITVIDLYHQIIPNELSLPGIVVGFIACFATGDITWVQSLLGILLGGGIFWAIAAGYEKYSGREGLGGGDIKLLGMIGAWLGYKCLLPVIIISSATGSVIGLTLMAVQRKNFKTAIPFGPFLALGAVIYLFWGNELRSLFLIEVP